LRTSLNNSSLTWNYATDLPSLAIALAGLGNIRYYIYTPAGTLLHMIDAASQSRRFYHFDETGSTVLLTDDSGAVTDSYGISAYGESVTHSGPSDNPFTWQGQFGVMQEGSTSLYYMRERYYDSATARFLSPDPIVSNDPLEINPYQFARMDPVNVEDPTGLHSSCGMSPLISLADLRAGIRVSGFRYFNPEILRFQGEEQPRIGFKLEPHLEFLAPGKGVHVPTNFRFAAPATEASNPLITAYPKPFLVSGLFPFVAQGKESQNRVTNAILSALDDQFTVTMRNQFLGNSRRTAFAPQGPSSRAFATHFGLGF
jgi:RHS repeat-associated protein